MTSRARVLLYGATAALTVAGIAVGFATGGLVHIIAIGVVGLAMVAAISLAFLEVGLSEDRERAGQPGDPRPSRRIVRRREWRPPRRPS